MKSRPSPPREAVGLEIVSRGPLLAHLADPKKPHSCRPVKNRMYTSVDVDVEARLGIAESELRDITCCMGDTRYDSPVHLRVLHRLHALQHDRPVQIIAQERQVLSRGELSRRRLLQPPAAAPGTFASSSLAARHLRNASRSRGNKGRSSGPMGTPMRCMNAGSDVPTCAPTPAMNGRYAVSRSCRRQPDREKVSSVMKSAVKPAASAWHKDRKSRVVAAWPIKTVGNRSSLRHRRRARTSIANTIGARRR
jgi:hypothetical protein